jgi:alanine racemase
MSLSQIEIGADALRHNVKALQALVPPGTAVVAVVKGNAYGHGLSHVVPVLEPEVAAFQVDDLEELRELRKLTTKRALVLGYVPRAGLEEAVELGAELTLYDTERIPVLTQAAQRVGRQVRVHLKVDALLGRQGVLPEHLEPFLAAVHTCPELEVVSAYAHFANIEDTTDLSHAWRQLDCFDEGFQQIKALWPDVGRHLSATSGLMTVEGGQRNDLVRLGIGLYGMYPSAPLERRYSDLELQPAMRWVSHLAQVKTLPPRFPVGYGLTYITPREMRVGIVPQGYSDGYDRGLSNSGEVLVRGQRCPVIGRVAMNMFTVDLTNAPDAQAEDEVVLLGAQRDDHVAAEELALRIGTINYEVTTRVCALLPRVVV